MGNRMSIPTDIETAVLTSSRRRCSLCFGLNQDLQEKRQGQIAHLDHNASNPKFDNLAWLCFNHHDAYDSKSRQSKNYKISEVKSYRNKLYEVISSGKLREDNELITESSYDAGTRIKIIREELGLKTSQFSELLCVESQREYELMEARQNEAPVKIIEQVSRLAGTNIEWLKHETGPRYKREHLYLNPVDRTLAFCESLDAQEYFLVLDKKQLDIGLVAQTSKYFYQFMTIGGVTLDFWNWQEHLWEIPAFFDFLTGLSNSWHDIEGILLPTKIYKKLQEGEIHFLTALNSAERYGGDLLYDILDVDEMRSKPFLTYSKAYRGNWMHKVHQSYKQAVAELAVNKEFDDVLIERCKNLAEKGIDVSYIQNEFKNYHGVMTAKRLFYWKKGLEQLKKIQDKGLLDQSVESLVLQKKFESLFTKEDVAEARRRLDNLGYFKRG
jgi:DNA-binding transcriptional regulator YiaG